MFRLTGPDGTTTVNLVDALDYTGSRPGSGRIGVGFDDEAATTVFGQPPTAGSFRPAGLLAAFDGMDMFGTWTLMIQDTTLQDPLEYFSSRLEFDAGPAAVPEPASLGLLALGLIGIGAARRRRHAA